MNNSLLNRAEKMLIDTAPAAFPMIRAASVAAKRCGKCGYGRINIHSMLMAAATRYAEDAGFKAYLKNAGIQLPTTVGGILIGDIK